MCFTSNEYKLIYIIYISIKIKQKRTKDFEIIYFSKHFTISLFEIFLI